MQGLKPALLRRLVVGLDEVAVTHEELGGGSRMETQEWEDARELEKQLAPHKHSNNSWLICGGYVEWCYQCGAWRQLRRDGNGLFADGKWHRPTGNGGPNPWKKD